MAVLKKIEFGEVTTPIAKTIVKGKGVIEVTNTGDRANDDKEQLDYSYDIDVKVDGTTIVKDGGQLAVGTVPAAQVSVDNTTAGITSTTAQAAFKELKDKIDNVKDAAKSYTIVKDDSELESNVKEQYVLQQTVNGVVSKVGAPIKIYKDSSLKSVELKGQALVFTYILDTGAESAVSVDVSTFLAESEFKDGLVVTDHVVKVKVDGSSEGFLTVGTDGVKLSGVQEAINNAVAGLDFTDAAKAGMYVSAVSETDGVISVERLNVADAVLNGYAKGEKPDSTVIAATDKVKDAIAKLEHQVDAAKAAATTKVVEGTDEGNNLTVVPTTSEADGSTTYAINLTDVASKAALNAEITARRDADTKLTQDLAAEVTRAQAAEQEIATKVNAIKYNVDGTTLIVVGIPQDETLKANKA